MLALSIYGKVYLFGGHCLIHRPGNQTCDNAFDLVALTNSRRSVEVYVLFESCIFGDSFIITVAIRIAYGHKLVDMELGQHLFACIIIVGASPWMVLIRLSANPF